MKRGELPNHSQRVRQVQTNRCRHRTGRNPSSTTSRKGKQPQGRAKGKAKFDDKLEIALGELREIRDEQRALESSPRQLKTSGEPTTAASVVHSVSPRDTSHKLKVAEAVMRKLYLRNLELEERLSRLPPSSPVHYPATSGGSNSLLSREQADPDDPSVEALFALQTQGEIHLRFMIEEKERTILELRDSVKKLTTRLARLSGASGGREANLGDGNRAAVRRQLEDAQEQAKVYKAQFERVRRDYRRAMGKRAEEWVMYRAGGAGGHRGGRLAKATRMVQTLSEQLASQTAEHEHELEAFHTKLQSAEQQNCDGFVEKRILETRLAQVMAELHDRDAIEEKVQECVYGIYEHLRALELENQALRSACPSSNAG